MKADFLNALQIALFLIVLTCLVSIMAVFMGGGQASTDLHSMFVAQIAAIPLAIVVIATSLIGSNMRTLWSTLPQWLVFIVLLLNALALCGEVALIIAARMTDHVGPWQEHVPLACTITCSIAFLLLYARTHPNTENKTALTGRW